ncbi:MAG: HIT domain-containing protein [Bacilli bacterium]|nr:HIT domain-containing protein [Bacilli bacterium]MDD3304715.1 HIT domain-containing protein [Bacilli bacterium]MDD4053606.1 HIT domain-containing protein [Bacilli bacterium]MDD4411105.1 HIT domain-containing protein [Bacilli bacterium]
MDCIFCKIINGDIPSYTIYEDDMVKVFLDANPHSNGHMLIISKEHFLDIMDIEKDVLTYIYKDITPKMYKLLQDKLGIDGLKICQNNGIAQEVKHYHVHLIPTYKQRYELLDIKEIYGKLV